MLRLIKRSRIKRPVHCSAASDASIGQVSLLDSRCRANSCASRRQPRVLPVVAPALQSASARIVCPAMLDQVAATRVLIRRRHFHSSARPKEATSRSPRRELFRNARSADWRRHESRRASNSRSPRRRSTLPTASRRALPDRPAGSARVRSSASSNRHASREKISESGLRLVVTKVSTACAIASKPEVAVMLRGCERVSAGSRSATRNAAFGSPQAILT